MEFVIALRQESNIEISDKQQRQKEQADCREMDRRRGPEL